ncbi:MAG: hypothetical protein RR992_03575 [Clostridiales bacterium]
MEISQINEKLLYHDSFSVSRLEKQVMANKTTHQTLVPVNNLQNLSCRISRMTQDDAKNDNPMANQIAVGLLLFTDVRHGIKAGDTIEVTSHSQSQSYLAGEPYMYDTHQQVVLYRKDDA